MTLQRLLELGATIAQKEGGEIKCVVKTLRQVSDDEVVEYFDDVKDLCLSKEGELLIRT